jgi:hypothetical protein
MAHEFKIAEAFVELTSRGAVAEQIQKQIKQTNELKAAYKAQSIFYADNEAIKQIAITKTLEKQAESTKHFADTKAGVMANVTGSSFGNVIPTSAISGIATFRTNMLLAQESVAKFGERISGLRNIAAVAFGAISGSILATVAVSNPATFMKFEQAIRSVAGVIGQMFAPILERVTEVIQSLAGWIYSLSAGSKQAIVAVTVGVAVLAGGFLALTAAVWVVNTAMIAFNTLTGGILFIIGAVVMAIGAFAGGVLAASAATAGWGKVMLAVDKIMAALSVVMDTVGGVIAELGINAGDVFEFIGDVISQVTLIVATGAEQLRRFIVLIKEFFNNPFSEETLAASIAAVDFADVAQTVQAKFELALKDKKAAPLFSQPSAGSIGDYQKDLQLAAFKVPIQQQQLDKLGEIRDTLEEIVKNTMGLPDARPVLN